MSITTYGWGSGSITTQGWGAVSEVPAPVAPTFPDLGFGGDLLHLIIQLRILVRCKVDPTTLEAQIQGAHVQLDEVESCLEECLQRLRGVEGTHPLLVSAEYLTDCKIDETTVDDRIAASDVTLDGVQSGVSESMVRLRALERALRMERRRRR